jgi:hypothetical protein
MIFSEQNTEFIFSSERSVDEKLKNSTKRSVGKDQIDVACKGDTLVSKKSHTTPETTIQLLEECLKQKSIKQISEKLNVCVGTVNRWIDLKNVPIQYTFDLYKILSKKIDYSLFSSSLKDQFYTSDEVAINCWNIFKRELGISFNVSGTENSFSSERSVEEKINKYIFIEPSAGNGSFLKILPEGSIGIDIEPRFNGIQEQDYLTWEPEDKTKKYIVFGNPPFGLRGHIALNFINHSYKFADYVCFILPQLFESDGKGSPRKRVLGYNLIYSENLSAMFYIPKINSSPEFLETNLRDSSERSVEKLEHLQTFVERDNMENFQKCNVGKYRENIKINVVFQIWSKHTSNPIYTVKKISEDNMKVYSLSDGGTIASTRNKNMIEKCDIYLPSTCFGKENMRTYKCFEELPGKKGYGIVFFKEKLKMIQKAETIDWSIVSFLSTNSAYNLRTSIIFNQFT